ncbi:unnamed protein product, partial [Prorocentrum cordatum]
DKGLNAKSFDKVNSHRENLLSVYGLMYAVYLIRSVVVGGTVWLSPDCSSWLVFLTRNIYKRTLDNLKGDVTKAKTREDNACAEVTAYLAMMAAVRGAYIAVENPLASLLFKFAPIASALQILG